MNEATLAVSPAPLIPVRYRILGLLFVVSFVNYLLRNNLSTAQPAIMDAYHFTYADFGLIFLAFNISYALFQIPGGVFGDLVGSRRALAIVTVCWGVLTALTGFLPGLMGTTAGVIAAFMGVRFLLGITNAPMYPVAAGAFANWFPPARWALPNAVLSSGLTLGQAATGPVVVWLILVGGWQLSFYALAPIGIIVGLWWWWYGRDRPAEHASVSAQELELINAGRTAPVVGTPGGWKLVLAHRDVLLLTASYFCMNYVFYIFSQWLFTYLVKERGFAQLEGGWLYALPFVVGAVLAAIGGGVCDALCKRIGPRWGCRLPAFVSLLLVAILLVAGAKSPHPYVAVVLLALCFGFTQFAEGPFWAASTYVAGPNTASATGVLNTGGNLAGLLAPLTGIMLDHYGWWPTLASGSAFAVAAAVLWLFVRVQPPPAQHR
ncbi:MAG TPA: MFS transporter [Steroidobacteraceae bacterium]